MDRGRELLKGKKEISPNVFMHTDEFISIALDKSIPPEDKKRIYGGEFKSKKDYLEKTASERKQLIEEIKLPKGQNKTVLTDKEIMSINPVHIDPKIEALRHLHPEQLERNKKF